jgi:SM-20-related protein
MNIDSLVQISDKVFCKKFLLDLDIKTKLLPNPYYEYPFMIIKNFLSTKSCEEITALSKVNKDSVDAQIRTYTGTMIKPDINTEIRKTKIHKLSPIHQNIYDKNFLDHQKDIETFFNLPLTTSTKIQVLEYSKGSFYKQHSDDSNVLVKDGKIIGFKPVAPQRKLTSILFTTSHSDIISENTFNGGEVIFNYLYDDKGNNIQIKPNAGDMLVFLSNPYFTHEVLKVRDGCRVSLVQWHDCISK